MIANTVSDTIRVARILCILLLVYAHAPPFTAGVPDDLFSPTGAIYSLRLLLGQGSVPLLALVSGYLLAESLGRRPFKRELKNKVLTLLVPLVLWNLLYIAKEMLESGARGLPTLAAWPNAVLSLTAPPAMMPLYFLRDVFLCFLVSPLVAPAMQRWPLLVGAAWLVNGVLNADGVLFINSAIPFFFFVGVFLQPRANGLPTRGLPTPVVVLAATALVGLAVAPMYRLLPPGWSLTLPHSPLYGAAAMALLGASCVLTWHAACVLRDRHAGRWLARYEPIAFLIFCIHGMAAGIWWMVAVHSGVAASGTGVLAYFLLSTLLVLVTSVVVAWVSVLAAPRLLAVALGGRAPTQQQVAHMLRLRPSIATRF